MLSISPFHLWGLELLGTSLSVRMSVGKYCCTSLASAWGKNEHLKVGREWRSSRLISFPMLETISSYCSLRTYLLALTLSYTSIPHLMYSSLLCLIDAEFFTNWRQDLLPAKRLWVALLRPVFNCSGLESTRNIQKVCLYETET